jgi:hypothetical protein
MADSAQAKKKSDTVKESKPRKSKKVPSDDKLQSEIRELLKDADFSKVSVALLRHELAFVCSKMPFAVGVNGC